MNQAIVTKMNFTFLERIPKAVYVFKQQKLEQLFNYQNPVRRDRKSRRKLHMACQQNPRNNKRELQSGLVNLSEYEVSETVRDGDYLTYRYLDYPFFKYHVFLKGESTSSAVLVARIVGNQGRASRSKSS